MFVRTTYNNIYEIKGNTVFNLRFGCVSLDRIDKFESIFGKVIKESENISDLVDGYWWENSHYHDPIFNPNIYIAKERLESWLECDKELETNLSKDISVYGSIYINGEGWKHVSKLIVENNEIKEVLL